jgi:hypothetical protein
MGFRFSCEALPDKRRNSEVSRRELRHRIRSQQANRRLGEVCRVSDQSIKKPIVRVRYAWDRVNIIPSFKKVILKKVEGMILGVFECILPALHGSARKVVPVIHS